MASKTVLSGVCNLFRQIICFLQLEPIARGIALFLGGFALLNILGEFRQPGFDSNCWWIDLRPTGYAISRSLLGVVSAVLLFYAMKPRLGQIRKKITLQVCVLLVFFCELNIIAFYWLMLSGKISAGIPVPFSLFVCAGIMIIFRAITTNAKPEGGRKEKAMMYLTVFTVAMLFPLGQMYFFGKTDYRRNADAIVVLGARVYADGRCSDALADRVRTGCQLYNEGLAGVIVFSGGPGDGDIHETDAMRTMAIGLGVPAEAIIVDRAGLCTQATVENTCQTFAANGIDKVLVVSHFYHLPRIKLTYQRNGLEVYTIPAKERCTLRALPKYLLREIAALWVYYIRPLA
ncbi:MAG: YdcF family protein [Anaerohalosphaera sp.]|nr:YdcF family protein [Anaerohalosphaera sp.]